MNAAQQIDLPLETAPEANGTLSNQRLSSETLSTETVTAACLELRPRLFSYFRNRGFFEDELDEQVQETIFKAMTAKRKPRHPKKLRAWIFAIAHNVYVDTVRYKERIEWQLVDDEATYTWRGPLDRAYVRNFFGHIQDRLDRARAEMSPQQDRCFMLKYFQCLTQEEIAAELKISRASVATHLRRALERTRKHTADLRDFYIHYFAR